MRHRRRAPKFQTSKTAWPARALLSMCLCVAVGITTRPSFALSSVVPSAPATPGAATTSHPVFAVGDMVTPTQSVILRGGPTNNSAVVTILIPGDSLTILFGPEQGDSDLWYEVMQTADGTAGWLPADLLRLASPATGSAASPTVISAGSATPTASTPPSATPMFAVGDTVMATDTVNLRSGPSPSASIVTILIAGDTVTIVAGPEQAENYSWYQVRTADGTQGWLAADFLVSVSVTSPESATPTAATPPGATPTPAPWATAEAQVRKTANDQCSDKLRALTLAVSALSQVPPLNTFSAGRLAHNPGDNFVTSVSTGLDVQDFALYVEFQSPFSPAVHPWDFSVLFRYAADGSQLYWLTIDSYGRWTVQFEHVVAGQQQTDDVMAGTVPNLRTSKGAWNGLLLIARGGQGFVFLNGRSIAEVNLAENQIAGDISLAVGREGNTERAGATTAYRNLGIWDLADAGVINGACLTRSPGD